MQLSLYLTNNQTTPITGVTANANYQKLDMYLDETIDLTSKLSDIEKLSNVFTDLTNSFTLPASSVNDALFKYYWDIDNDGTFNANIRVLAYIEIDSLPLRFGTLQLEGVTLKNGRPDVYKITFYGGLVQLTDLFGSDLLANLDYKKDDTNNLVKTWDSISRFDFPFTESSFVSLLTDPTYIDGLIMPLINYGDKEWNYGTAVNNSTSIDIATSVGAINSTAIRPAMRVIEIIKAIETKYDISFSRTFFGSAQFNNLYVTLNGNLERQRFQLDFTSQFNSDGYFPDPRGYLTTVDLTTNIIKIETFDVSSDPKGKNDIFQLNLNWPFSGAGQNFSAVDGTDVTMTVSFIDRRPGRDGIVFFTQTKTFAPADSVFYQNNFSATDLGIDVGSPLYFDIFLQTNKTVTWNSFRFTAEYSYLPPYDIFLYQDKSNNTIGLTSDYKVNGVLPNITVLNFLQGLMKAFKLVIRPITPTTFDILPIDDYYAQGNILNISEYIDNEDINIERPLIYNKIEFLFEPTNNVLGKRFREVNDPINDKIGYGDLQAQYNSVQNNQTLEVKLPFENMLFERLIDDSTSTTTPILIGESISVSDSGAVSSNKSKPMLFYNNGIVDLDSTNDYPIKVRFKSTTTATTINKMYLVGNTDDEILSQVTNTVNWGSENDPWHQSRIDNSLYLNYWSNWIKTIYDLKQRKFTFNAILPPRFVQELSLNDTLIIGSNRYKINDFQLNLNNGEAKLSLFKDIFSWNEYSFPNPVEFTPFALTSSWILTDYSNKNSDTAYLYGSFTDFNSTAYGHILKIKKDGTVDNTFETGTGFNNNTYRQQLLLELPNGKLFVTGDFTSFSGTAANRIIKLNNNGSIDTSFVYGSGFNNETNGIGVDSKSNVIIGGSFTSYSGISINRIIKLSSGGTVNSSFRTAIGTGFNNIVSSIIVNNDDTFYVGGYFSAFNGTAANRIIKLISGGTIDTSFVYGSGFNSSTSFPLNLLDSNGLICYGSFTTYSGITSNGIIKLNTNGSVDYSFNIGSGFDDIVHLAKVVMGDKILVAGDFTTYNGITSNGTILLNQNGSIYRTFNETYQNVYTIGNYVYGNLTTDTILIDDESLPTLDNDLITMNSGVKYYGINVLKNIPWSVSLVDIGFGTSGVTLTTLNGNGAGECVIRVENNSTGAYRETDVLFDFNGTYRSVRVHQNSL